MKTSAHKKLRWWTTGRGTIALATLVAVFGLLLWGRLKLKDVPRIASADPKAASKASQGSDHRTPSLSTTDERPSVLPDVPHVHRRDRSAVEPSPYKPPRQWNILEKVAKSSPVPTDKRRRTDEVRKLATGLELQRVQLSPFAQAVINGIKLVPGQKIQGFTLRRVFRRQVLIEKGNTEILLEI